MSSWKCVVCLGAGRPAKLEGADTVVCSSRLCQLPRHVCGFTERRPRKPTVFFAPISEHSREDSGYETEQTQEDVPLRIEDPGARQGVAAHEDTQEGAIESSLEKGSVEISVGGSEEDSESEGGPESEEDSESEGGSESEYSLSEHSEDSKDSEKSNESKGGVNCGSVASAPHVQYTHLCLVSQVTHPDLCTQAMRTRTDQQHPMITVRRRSQRSPRGPRSRRIPRIPRSPRRQRGPRRPRGPRNPRSPRAPPDSKGPMLPRAPGHARLVTGPRCPKNTRPKAQRNPMFTGRVELQKPNNPQRTPNRRDTRSTI